MDSSNKNGPMWLQTFVATEYFTEGCTHCTTKCETRFFCVDCCKGPLCLAVCEAEHKGHIALQVRKVSRSFSVKVTDIDSLVNVDDIHPYLINSAKVVYLPTRKHDNKSGNGYNCESCRRSLEGNRHGIERFCSISCKASAILKRPSDTSVTLAVAARATSSSYMHSSAKDLSATSPPSLSPSVPEKKRARKRPQSTKNKSVMVPPGPSWEKMHRKGNDSPTSVLSGPDRQADIPDSSAGESTGSHLSIERSFSFRKKARKGLPIRAPGLGIQQRA